ncbi:hypothetical protein Leryth_005000 [Lithospermum erythrorhizon]|nr:hypothetical protein Leryth_005000 [Lithospermum erythrorhizon]
MATAATMVSSAGGLLAMLNEPNSLLKHHALTNLNNFVDFFWPEISTSVPIIESLYEDEEFDQRQLAALLVSKVFYYLGELNDSLSYALGAGPLFDVSEDSDYVGPIFFFGKLRKFMDDTAYPIYKLGQIWKSPAKALDEYASLRTKAAESNTDAVEVDPRLEAIVERMLEKCIEDGRINSRMLLNAVDWTSSRKQS